MARRRAPQPQLPINLLQRVWQPALSVGAILISVTSLVQADRANDLAERQFEAEQQRQRQEEEKAKKEARQIVLADLSDDLRTVRFSIASEDVRLRSVFLEFPPQLKMQPIWTVVGRPQELSVMQLEDGLSRWFLPPDHGPILNRDVLAFVPVVLIAEFSGRGESFTETSIYTVQLRSRIVNGRPRLNFESFQPDVQLVGGLKPGDPARILARCWPYYLPGVGRHDLNNSPTDGYNSCSRSVGRRAS